MHYHRISLGDDVFIGERSMFYGAVKGIRIGNKVMFGPAVTILGGDHRFDVIGQYMWDVTEKLAENDQEVVIDDDVWVGAGAIILKGVHIGRGSVIGAGSIVTRSIPPYSIYTGSPAPRVRERWNSEQITAHNTLLRRR